MELRYFTNKELYPIRIADYGLSGYDGVWLLYSPLAHSFVKVDESELTDLDRQLAVKGCFEDSGLQAALIDSAASPKPNYVLSPRDVFALTVLPNNICNFSCSYCYAAKGHGGDELDEARLRTVLDYFIDSSRINRRDLYISFGGGGEPMLSWERVGFVLRYSRSLAEKGGFDIHYSYASNGSVINDEILQTVKDFNIKTNISFDILPDVQNSQRGHYDVVCKTLDAMLANDIHPTINSVITPLNVERQEEMVESLYQRFGNGLRRLSFDYVVDGKLFDDVAKLEKFYDTYTEHFYAARKLGSQYGISVSSIKHHNLSLLKSRACAGGFDLTPQGKLSMCFFISSPQETLYDDFIYGEVKDGKVLFDEDKFRNLVEYSSNSQGKCRNCFLRWHCGGGCLFHAKSYSPAMLDAMCRFQRRFSLIGLLEGI